VLVTTQSAANVDSDSARLRGQLWVTGHYWVWFEWRESGASTWTSTTAQYEPAASLFSADISSLVAATGYEFRAVVGYVSGGSQIATDYGATLDFTTAAT
jgi:hypothetical protein